MTYTKSIDGHTHNQTLLHRLTYFKLNIQVIKLFNYILLLYNFIVVSEIESLK